jgi:hypothetical protein
MMEDRSVSPHLCAGLAFTVPVEIDVPPEALAACRKGYEYRLANGGEPRLENFLWDLIEWEPHFTVAGAPIDMETGYAQVNSDD